MNSNEELQNNLLRWTRVQPLTPASPHTTSLSTRRPSFYDLHMPSMLQPQKISFGNPRPLGNNIDSEEVSSASDRYFQRLFACDREASVKALRGTHAHELESRWTMILQTIGANFFVHNEDGVVDAQRQAFDVVTRLATLVLFDLSERQIEHLNTWRLLVATTSLERDVKADIIIRLLTKTQTEVFDNLLKGKCEPIWPLVQDLSSNAYMECISTMECKNLLLGNPIAYLTLLSLIRLMQCGAFTELWQQTDCKSCLEFRNSHDAHHFQWNLPLDSAEQFGLAASSNLDDIDTEIIRILRIISLSSDTTPEVVGDATVREPKYRDEWVEKVHPHMRNLWNIELKSQVNDAGLQVPDVTEIMRWVPRVRHIFIQCWAQMVRHNLTFGSITSFNTSFGVQRVRQSSQAIISPFDHAEAEGYIIRQASWIVDAWEDARNRSEEESEMTPWSDIFAPNAAPKVDNDRYNRAPSHDPNDGDYDNDGNYLPPEEEGMAGGNQSRLRSQKQKQKKSTKPLRLDVHDGGRPRGGGSGGGAGGGGGAGSGGGANFSGGGGSGSTARKRGRHSPSISSGNTDKRARQYQDIQIRPEGLHLAFNCPGTHLGSSGFSHFTRILPLTISEPVKNPLDLPARFSRTKTPSPSRQSLASISSGTPSPSSHSSDSRSVLSTPPTDISTYTPYSLQSSPSSKDVHSASTSSHILGPNPSEDESGSLSVVTKVGVILEEKIGGLTGVIVWRGKLYLEGPMSEGKEPLPVVVKLADWGTNPEAEAGTKTSHGAILHHEAEIYEHIAVEGGKLTPPFCSTPSFYGIFENMGAIALVLGFGGANFGMPRSADALPKESKQTLFDQMVNLHAIGIEHGDIAGRNILEGTEDSGGPLIIDFEHSKLRHKCLGPSVCEELRSVHELLKLEKD
ncbi:hypothetical protein BT96DRAFT_927503 [Gymnopus androsaceus JB14]|uniref:Protein kinase domain-containing protein n=1 Tax=Gymnopus androsaceus JB14 TaxID=1447944 RepID=A0A6A4GQB9_9AGAR|nr:hypothetical protein BT96DRAFT_927503 [Gymnopus androsaceus JB14]